MRAMTQDPRQLAACLTELMVATESREVAERAGTLADQLDATNEPSAGLVMDAQRFLERHGVQCPGQGRQ